MRPLRSPMEHQHYKRFTLKAQDWAQGVPQDSLEVLWDTGF